MSKLRNLASQTAVYGLSYIAARVLNFLLTPYYTRLFDQADFGSFSLLYAWITFFNILYTYGMETGYFYFTAKQKGSHKLIAGTAFLSIAYSSLAFSGILLLGSGIFADLIGFPGRPDYVILAALILAFDAIAAIPFAQLRRENMARRFATVRFLNVVLTIVFNLFFLTVCPWILRTTSLSALHPLIQWIYSPDEGVRYVLLSNLLASFITFLQVYPLLKSMRLQFNKVIWRNMLKYTWPLLILGFAGMINETLDRILLEMRLPGTREERLAMVGVYSAAYKLSIFMTLAITSFRFAAEPFFFSQLKDLDGKELFARILKYFTFVTGVIFLGVIMYLPLVTLVLGKNFRTGLEVLPMLLLANQFLGLFYYLSQWYKQTGRTLMGAYVSVGGAVITLLVNFIFIPAYGYLASAWATLLCYAFMAIASYILGQRYYPIRYDLRRIGLYLGLPVFLFLVSNALSSRPLGELSLGMYIFNSLLLGIYLVVFLYLEQPPIVMKHPLVQRYGGRLLRKNN